MYGSLIGTPKVFKNTLFEFQGWTDVDQVKCHPTILLEVCKRNKISVPSYDDFLAPGRFAEIAKAIADHHSVPGQTPLDTHDVKVLFLTAGILVIQLLNIVRFVVRK